MRSELTREKLSMPALSNYTALLVNGEEVSLADALRLAKINGRLQFIEDALDAALIRQAAAERGIAATDEELQQAADDFRAAHGLHTAQSTMKWLEERRLTFEDWEALIEDELVGRKLREALTTEKVEQHFVENRLAFDSAYVSRLVVEGEDVAKELRAQIVEDGADFHALARAYSIDDSTKQAGGYSGAVRRSEMEAAVESAVFGAQPGKVAGPIKTDDGWLLIKVESLHPAVLDDPMRETIKSMLFGEWLAERRRKARVNVPLLEEAEAEEEETSA